MNFTDEFPHTTEPIQVFELLMGNPYRNFFLSGILPHNSVMMLETDHKNLSDSNLENCFYFVRE